MRQDATPSAIVVTGERLPARIKRYVTSLQRFRAGNTVRLLDSGGETFPAMLAAIAGARRQILLETYIVEPDRTGNQFAEALRARAREGLDVRLIYDAIGGLGLPADWIRALVDDGVKVVEYHPIAPWRARFNLSRRDHRKILVVDDEIGFTGGINLSDDYASIDDGGKGWHDMHCEVRGPAVLDLARLFRRTWLYAGGDAYPAPPRADTARPPQTGVLVRILENSHRRRKREIRRAYIHAINAAREEVAIENAYFLPDRGLRRALRNAVRRGVRVRVIVPGKNDLLALEYAMLYLARMLTRRGVQILHWAGPMMHSKFAVIDRIWAAVGSYNFDMRSFFYNLEVVAEIADPAYGPVVAAQFDADAAGSVAFDEAAWKSLPWWKKALAWLAFGIRGWL